MPREICLKIYSGFIPLRTLFYPRCFLELLTGFILGFLQFLVQCFTQFVTEFFPLFFRSFFFFLEFLKVCLSFLLDLFTCVGPIFYPEVFLEFAARVPYGIFQCSFPLPGLLIVVPGIFSRVFSKISAVDFHEVSARIHGVTGHKVKVF